MLSFRCSATIMAMIAMICLAGNAGAVPVGTGGIVVEVEVETPDDNTICTTSTGYVDQTYDVFGTNVNLNTDVGQMVCFGGTSGGVPQLAHCESYPDSSIFSLDLSVKTVCIDQPLCTGYNFITESVENVAGTLPAAIGSGVTYTIDGQINIGGTPPPIAGCPFTTPNGVFTGTAGINAFRAQTTSTGSDQTVSFPDTVFFDPVSGQQVPIDVGVNFSQVTGGGTTTVLASSNSSAEIPANFAGSVYGYNAVFLEVSTTATVVPPITICSTYSDPNNAGYLGGTSPPIPETALSFMHGEGDPKVFVDRTSMRDTVNNIICAQVDSLSPFVVAVRTNATCAAENDPCDDGDGCTINDVCNASLQCVGGGTLDCDDGNVCTADACQSPLGCVHTPAVASGCNATNGKSILLIKDNPTDAKDQVLFKWLKGDIDIGDFGDPTASTDYTLCVSDANKVLVSATAPAASTCGSKPCWSFTGPSGSPNGVKYNDPAKGNDGVKGVKGKASSSGKAKLLFKGLGANIPTIGIAGITYPVTAQVLTSDAGCWEQQFSAADEKKNDGSLFKAVHVAP